MVGLAKSHPFLNMLKHSNSQLAGDATLQCNYHESFHISAIHVCPPHMEISLVALSLEEKAKPEGKQGTP